MIITGPANHHRYRGKCQTAARSRNRMKFTPEQYHRYEKGPRRRESLTLVGEHSGIPEQSPLGQRGAVAAKPRSK